MFIIGGFHMHCGNNAKLLVNFILNIGGNLMPCFNTGTVCQFYMKY